MNHCAYICCLLALAVPGLLTGCAGLPTGIQRSESHALSDRSGTTLARVAAASLPDDAPMPSAMRLLPDGSQAFEALGSLIDTAERTIDAQYYEVAVDASGRAFLAALDAAAARGVRVRLLIDDLHAAGHDDLLLALAARPNLEVRMFNPLMVRSDSLAARVLFSLNDFRRVNRRMHNKLLVADNAFAISGGRNIADAYFGRGDKASHFIDMDVLSAGAVVGELSAAFDIYWNSELAYPIRSLVDEDVRPASRSALQAPPGEGAERRATDQDVLGQGSIGAQLSMGRVALHPAHARVVADAPRKSPHEAALADGVVMQANLALLQSARSEVLVASPYFVPGQRTLGILRQSVDNRVEVSVLTNSIATTDEPLVHHGYARYRQALLDMGVGLYELIPGAGAQAMANRPRGSLSRLHTKLAVVDGRWLSIGSMNMDRRSAHCNTEMNLLIDSPELAGQVAQLLRQGEMPRSYRVRRTDPAGSLEWVRQDEPQPQVFAAEPHASWALRLRMSLVSLFVSEELL
ncbi:MAG: phospholipase D family protein [Variovorax sp.]